MYFGTYLVFDITYQTTGNMKTQTINARMISFLLILMFVLSGFGQTSGPPGNQASDTDDSIIILTKAPDKKNCIEVKVSPNPIRSSATIEFTLKKAVVIQIGIYNQQGVMVMDVVKQRFDVGLNKVTFTPSNLPTGSYYICVSCGKKRGMRKCMII